MLELPGYEIEKQIGKGGMAKVYLAVHKGLHRKVAIKVMSLHLSEDENFSDRFMREARIVANLNHQNIVTVYDVNVHNGYHYIAMEYLPGGVTLDHKIKEGLAPRHGVEAIKQVAAALGYAHSKGIVHRDVKPENIMFREDGTAVLTDFGIARSTNSAATKMTSTGTVIGTPHYMSPEQAQGQEVGSYSDIYSLGVVLYETLTGKLPYEADTTIAVIFKHITEPVPTLESELAKYQPVLNRMMAKKKEDRYQSCAEIVADMNSLLMGGEVSKATLINDATRIQYDIKDKLARHQAAMADTHNKQSTAANEFSKNKFLIPGIAASVLLLASIGGYIIYSQRQPASSEQQQAAKDITAQQQLAELLAAKQAADKHAQDEADKLAQERATADAARQQELNRQQQEQTELKASKDAALAKEQLDKTQKITRLLASAENDLRNSQLKSAHESYKAVLQIDRNNRHAIDGINRVAGDYLIMAVTSARGNDFNAANQHIKSAITVTPNHNKLAETQTKVFDLKKSQSIKQSAQPANATQSTTLTPKMENNLAKNQKIPTKPEIDQVGELISEYKTALETKDLSKLRKISQFVPGREQFITSLFQQYKDFSVHISGFEFISNEHRGKATVELSKMTDKNNQSVIPGNWSKFEINTLRDNSGKFYVNW